MKRFLLIFLFLLLFFPFPVLARIGVGVGSGKITIDQKLKAGMIYELPPLMVLNTGDEPSEYEASVAYHNNQPQLLPPKEWFQFNPQKFYLEPGGVQKVEIRLNLPLRTEPGDYFAYLEGRPTIKAESGITTIGIAAASKLYFTIEPANFLEGIYYKLASLWKIYSPWTERVAAVLAIIVILFFIRNFFHIQVGLKKPTIKNEE